MEAYIKRFSSMQKLQAKTECEKCILLHVVYLRLILNQTCWTHLSILNMWHRKRVWTIESFFASNQSQTESEKNDTEDEQCIN